VRVSLCEAVKRRIFRKDLNPASSKEENGVVETRYENVSGSKEDAMATVYHEPYEALSPQARNVHRALTSLIEELEAVDWYNQRADVTDDADLKAILIHNRDEEVEHGTMLLEWIRRLIPHFDETLKTYLFTTGPITAIEKAAKANEAGQAPAPGASASSASLGIGRIRKGE
jgi:ferritin-like protein